MFEGVRILGVEVGVVGHGGVVLATDVVTSACSNVSYTYVHLRLQTEVRVMTILLCEPPVVPRAGIPSSQGACYFDE